MYEISTSVHWQILDFVLMGKKNAKEGKEQWRRKKKGNSSNVTLNENVHMR